MKRFVVSVAAALIAFVAVLVIEASGGGTYQVTAVFDQAYGIVSGGNVWTGGGAVGTISSIRLGADGLPHVTMRIDDSYRLRATATADLEMLSNSGELNRIVMLARGTGPELEDGATIPVSRTSEPVELDDVLGTFTPAVRAEMRGVLAELDGATDGLQNAFTATLRHSAAALGQTAALLGQVDSDGYALHTLIAQGHIAAAAFAAQRPALTAAVGNVSALLRATAARQASLASAVEELPAGLEQPRLALDRLHAEIPTLRGLVDALAPAADQLGPTSTVLARALGEAQPALPAIDATLRSAPPQLRALQFLLGVAEPAARALAPTLARALPILDVVRVYTPELVGFLSGWSDMGSSFDIAGHGLRFATAIIPPNKVTSPDSNQPGYIPPPFLRTPGALVGQPWTNYQTSYLSKTPPK